MDAGTETIGRLICWVGISVGIDVHSLVAKVIFQTLWMNGCKARHCSGCIMWMVNVWSRCKMAALLDALHTDVVETNIEKRRPG